MAMKLLVHVLRGATLDVDDTRGATPSIDPRRWGLRGLMVRRIGFAPWGFAGPAPAQGAGRKRREPAGEPLWADTQPWCHE